MTNTVKVEVIQIDSDDDDVEEVCQTGHKQSVGVTENVKDEMRSTTPDEVKCVRDLRRATEFNQTTNTYIRLDLKKINLARRRQEMLYAGSRTNPINVESKSTAGHSRDPDQMDDEGATNRSSHNFEQPTVSPSWYPPPRDRRTTRQPRSTSTVARRRTVRRKPKKKRRTATKSSYTRQTYSSATKSKSAKTYTPRYNPKVTVKKETKYTPTRVKVEVKRERH